jgi:hypothetical protein
VCQHSHAAAVPYENIHCRERYEVSAVFTHDLRLPENASVKCIQSQVINANQGATSLMTRGERISTTLVVFWETAQNTIKIDASFVPLSWVPSCHRRRPDQADLQSQIDCVGSDPTLNLTACSSALFDSHYEPIDHPCFL